MNVLVVDDAPDARALLQDMLRSAGYDVPTARSACEAYRMLGIDGSPPDPIDPIDLIIMDITMPGVDGLAACRRIKAVDHLAHIPIIVVTAHSESTALAAAFAAGARDFVAKPVAITELLARVRAALELTSEIHRRRAFEEALLEATRRLESANTMLERLSYLDWLTGVPNRMYFDSVMDSEWRRAHRDGAELALVMIDIDFFHAYNERYGHPQGDACLKQVAGALRSSMARPGDFVARYGGEEFAILLPATPPAGAVIVAEKLRAAVARLALPHAGSTTADHITVSVGVANGEPNGTLIELVAAADQALYRAKDGGRDQVCAAPLSVRHKARMTQPGRAEAGTKV